MTTSETTVADGTAATGDLDALLNEHFAGKVVRKDLTKLVKEGANVPVFVLEYLLGNYCSSQDEEVVYTLSLHDALPIDRKSVV